MLSIAPAHLPARLDAFYRMGESTPILPGRQRSLRAFTFWTRHSPDSAQQGPSRATSACPMTLPTAARGVSGTLRNCLRGYGANPPRHASIPTLARLLLVSIPPLVALSRVGRIRAQPTGLNTWAAETKPACLVTLPAAARGVPGTLCNRLVWYSANHRTDRPCIEPLTYGFLTVSAVLLGTVFTLPD